MHFHALLQTSQLPCMLLALTNPISERRKLRLSYEVTCPKLHSLNKAQRGVELLARGKMADMWDAPMKSLSLSLSPISFVPSAHQCPLIPFLQKDRAVPLLGQEIGERQGAGPYLAPLCFFICNKRKRLELMTLDRIL